MKEIDSIEIVPYDPAWPEAFAREAELLRKLFSDHKLSIEHIGSTAIPGIDAKPVIDIMVGFIEEIDPKELIRRLENVDYEWWNKDPHKHVRLFFVKWNQDKTKRTHQIHAMHKIGTDFWKDQISFRDKLRANQTLAQEYSDLKNSLKNEVGNNRHMYIEGKTSFVKRVLGS